MFNKLPELIDPINSVNHNKHIVARVNQVRLKRLAALVQDADREVMVDLEFYYNKALRMPAFIMKLETSLNLQCQRSLEYFDFPVTTEVKGVMTQSMALVDDVPNDVDIFEIQEDEKVSLPEWVEDELLLCVPLSPTKEGSSMPYENTSGTADQEKIPSGSDALNETSTSRPNPFAALQGLKK
ncbi:MAG: DUF177 domain-containing protein [Thiotrichales bacterium]|nr:DUF177 domain-containing protein [Thiotrichales bacterium]